MGELNRKEAPSLTPSLNAGEKISPAFSESVRVPIEKEIIPRIEETSTISLEIEETFSKFPDNNESVIKSGKKIKDLNEAEVGEALVKNEKDLSQVRRWLRRLGLGVVPVAFVLGNMTPGFPIGAGLLGFVSLPIVVRAVGIKQAVEDIRLVFRLTQIKSRKLAVHVFGEERVAAMEKSSAETSQKIKSILRPIFSDFDLEKGTAFDLWGPPAWRLLQRMFPGPPKKDVA